ncbi:amino acid permease [Acidianus sulfidivorans JP7]|uniref:Amino acid permease n=1 Tax=Acidianus sulfidivorans JP7 TaxID=619593 RepID=A0A2U9IN58_9CREN|nr:amino acid permease [Acidianus sulfidivorans]AWR97437.1 amino acid permease [Acidianus sulfidivorans JP7]
MSNKSIFVRESSGLLKQVTLLDAIMLNLGNMSAGIALFESISPYVNSSNNPSIGGPGGVLWLASILGFIFAIPQLILYTIMTRRISRTGGDYVWISRSLNGPLGVVMAISLLIESVAYFALVAFFSGSSINAVLCTIGNLDHSSSLINLAQNIFVNPYGTLDLTQKIIFYGISAAFFIIVILINIFRARWGYSIVTALGFFSFFTLILAMILIAANIHNFSSAISPFISDFNISVPPVKYTVIPSINWSYTLFLLPLFALYTYPWMQAGPAVSAEFKQQQKVAKLNLLLALIMTGIIVTLGFFEMDLAAGYYFNYYAYGSFIYNFWTVAIALSSNPIIQWILGLGTILWNFYVLSYGVIVFSRYVFALSFDRVLPEKFSQVNNYGSPVYAHVLDLGIMLLLLLIPVFSTEAAVSLYGATILGALYFLIVSAAGAFYGIRNKIPILSIASIISAIYFAFLTYEAGVNPIFGFNSTVDGIPITKIFVISVIAIGILVYLASWYMNKKKGIDISMSFKEIPPE